MKKNLISEEQEQIISDNMTENDIDQQISDIAEMQKQTYPVDSEFERIYDSESPNDNYLKRLEEIQRQAREELNKGRQQADIEKAAAGIMKAFSYGPGYGGQDFYDPTTEKRALEDYERTLKEYEALKPNTLASSKNRFYKFTDTDPNDPNTLVEGVYNVDTGQKIPIGRRSAMTPFQKRALTSEQTKEQRLEQQFKETQDRLKDQKIQENMQKLGKDLQSSAEMSNALSSFENLLGFELDKAAIDKNKILVSGKKIDLPGTNIPGIGRVSFYDQNARELDTAASKIFNVTLKDRSGAAVTTPEMDRLKEEFGAGKYNNEAELIKAVKKYKDELVKAMAQIESRYSKDVKQAFIDEGGITSQRFKTQNKTESKTVERRTKDGKIAIFDAETKKFIKYKD